MTKICSIFQHAYSGGLYTIYYNVLQIANIIFLSLNATVMALLFTGQYFHEFYEKSSIL